MKMTLEGLDIGILKKKIIKNTVGNFKYKEIKE